jgi:hypothetical protein
MIGNVPPIERVERLEREVKAVREALARVMGAMLQVLPSLSAPGRSEAVLSKGRHTCLIDRSCQLGSQRGALRKRG